MSWRSFNTGFCDISCTNLMIEKSRFSSSSTAITNSNIILLLFVVTIIHSLFLFSVVNSVNFVHKIFIFCIFGSISNGIARC